MESFNTTKEKLILENQKSDRYSPRINSGRFAEDNYVSSSDETRFKKPRKIGRDVLKIRQKFDTHTYIFNLSECQGENKEILDKYQS